MTFNFLMHTRPRVLSKERIVVWDARLSFLAIFAQIEQPQEITVR